MVEIARVVACNRVAPPAQGARVPDEGDFIVFCGFLIRLFCVAIKAHLDVKRPIGLDLVMGVQRLIFFSVVAAVTEVRFAGIGCSPQGIPAKQSLLALPIYIVAGVACEFPVLQREAGRHGQ